MIRVVVVGGGISGLVAAWALHVSGAPVRVTLLEQSNRLGGVIRTERYRGLVMEHGPDIFLSRKPQALQLCKRLGVPVQRTRQDRAGVFLRVGSGLHRMPAGTSGLVPTRLAPLLQSPLLSTRAKARVLLDLVRPGNADNSDESIRDFFSRRIGSEAFSTLIEPMLAGLSGGDAGSLSMAAILPHVAALERSHGSLLMGLSSAKAGAGSVSPVHGMDTLVTALGHRLGDVIRLSHRVTAVALRTECATIEVAGRPALDADDVILALPAGRIAELVRSADPSMAASLDEISYGSMTTVQLAYDHSEVAHALNGYGYVVSRKEATPVVACTWSSSKLEHRAPPGTVLLRLYLANAGAPGFDEIEVLRLARAEVRGALGIQADPLLTRTACWSQAIPRYTLGHLDRVKRIRARMALHVRLHVAGAWIDGVGIPDCIRNGEASAAAVLARHGLGA